MQEEENRWEGKKWSGEREGAAQARMVQKRERKIAGIAETKLLFMGKFPLHPSPLFLHSTHPFLWLSCFLCQSIFYSCRSRAMNPSPAPHHPQLSEWQMRVRMGVGAKWKAGGVRGCRAEWWRNMKSQENSVSEKGEAVQLSEKRKWLTEKGTNMTLDKSRRVGGEFPTDNEIMQQKCRPIFILAEN